MSASKGKPKTHRPLLGKTILIVTGDDTVAEAMRLFARRMGARIRRASDAKSKRRHLQVYEPSIIIDFTEGKTTVQDFRHD